LDTRWVIVRAEHNTINNESSSPRKYKRYDENFKRSAVEMWLQGDKSAAQICRELGIGAQSLKQWKKQLAALPTCWRVRRYFPLFRRIVTHRLTNGKDLEFSKSNIASLRARTKLESKSGHEGNRVPAVFLLHGRARGQFLESPSAYTKYIDVVDTTVQIQWLSFWKGVNWLHLFYFIAKPVTAIQFEFVPSHRPRHYPQL
jgi:Transposase